MKRSLLLNSLLLTVCFSVTGCWTIYSKLPDIFKRTDNTEVKSASDKKGKDSHESEYIGTTRGVVADCVVTYYSTDGSRYLSEQRHWLDPLSDTIVISADEPYGTFAWKLSAGSFQTLAGEDQVDELPRTLCEAGIAQVILTSFTAGAGFLRESGKGHRTAVKIEGQWYQPIELRPQGGRWGGRTVLRNMESSIMDMVQVKDRQRKDSLVGRSYNHRWLAEIGNSVPMKIDVFSAVSAEKTVSTNNHIMQIHYHTMKKVHYEPPAGQ